MPGLGRPKGDRRRDSRLNPLAVSACVRVRARVRACARARASKWETYTMVRHLCENPESEPVLYFCISPETTAIVSIFRARSVSDFIPPVYPRESPFLFSGRWTPAGLSQSRHKCISRHSKNESTLFTSSSCYIPPSTCIWTIKVIN